MIRDGRRREKPGELEPAVTVRRAHHGNLHALIAQSSDTSGPFSFDRGPPFEIEAELAKKSDRRFEIIDDDSYIVHSLKRHVSNLQGGHYSDNGPCGNCSEAMSTRCSRVSANRLRRRRPATVALAQSYASAGYDAAVRKIVNQLSGSEKRYVSPYNIARIYGSLAEPDRALEWLEKAYEEHNPT
jgi:hypothetical protein